MIKFLAFLFLLAFAFKAHAQPPSYPSNSYLTLGFAMQPQDRRIFDFPDWVLENEENKFDFEYSLLFTKAVVKQSRWATLLTGGWSVNHATFGRPFDHPYFTGVLSKELRIVTHYLTHNLNLGINQHLIIAKGNGNSFYLQSPLLAKIAVRKHIKNGDERDKKFNKWLFEPNNIELYLGLGCKFKRVDIGLAYRAVNLQHKDPAIFYSDLFDAANPDFLRTKYEWKNLTKIWLTATYKLRKD